SRFSPDVRGGRHSPRAAGPSGGGARNLRTVGPALFVATIVAMTASVAAAQTFTGGLRGAVKDANGVIPGVTVTLTNVATNVTRETTSNDSREYSFPAVQPGTYTIKASLTGFKSYENQNVRISTQQFVTLDIALEVGALAETITVTGQPPLSDTTTASTGGRLDAAALESLPAPGRNAFLIGI